MEPLDKKGYKSNLVEFPFNNRAFSFGGASNLGNSDFASVFRDRRTRGADVGITSVKWSFEGTDPVTANKYIRLELNVFFSNINGLTLERRTGSGKRFRYSDLIERRKDFELQHKIRALLGWSVPH